MVEEKGVSYENIAHNDIQMKRIREDGLYYRQIEEMIEVDHVIVNYGIISQYELNRREQY